MKLERLTLKFTQLLLMQPLAPPWFVNDDKDEATFFHAMFVCFDSSSRSMQKLLPKPTELTMMVKCKYP